MGWRTEIFIVSVTLKRCCCHRSTSSPFIPFRFAYPFKIFKTPIADLRCRTQETIISYADFLSFPIYSLYEADPKAQDPFSKLQAFRFILTCRQSHQD
ncbi:hypothetical protein ACLOJK_011962 [Asimina triloba]